VCDSAATRPSSQITLGRLVTVIIMLINVIKRNRVLAIRAPSVTILAYTL